MSLLDNIEENKKIGFLAKLAKIITFKEKTAEKEANNNSKTLQNTKTVVNDVNNQIEQKTEKKVLKQLTSEQKAHLLKNSSTMTSNKGVFRQM